MPTTCWALLSYSSHIICRGGCIFGHVPTYLFIYYAYFSAAFHGVVPFVPLIPLRRPGGKFMGHVTPRAGDNLQQRGDEEWKRHRLSSIS